MAPTKPQRILLVEDDPDIQMVARMALELIGGFTVFVCSSGSEVLKIATSFVPDLILADIMMPEGDTPSMLVALREQVGLGETPVICITAQVLPSDMVRYRELGVIDVITKPFDPISLPDTVTTIWSTHYG